MFTIEIAEIPIAVNNRFKSTKLLFRDYLSDGLPLLTVSASEEEMKQEEGSVSPRAEQLCIIRKMGLLLTDYSAFLMHAAVIDVDGQGVGFAARSGTGKTTRVLLWRRAMGERVKVVNGDKPILRFRQDGLYAYGTPWMGKEGMGANTSVRMKAMCFIERGEEVSARRMHPSEIVPMLLRQVMMPRKAEKIQSFMNLMERFAVTVPCYLFTCNMDKEKPEELWELIRSEQTA